MPSLVLIKDVFTKNLFAFCTEIHYFFLLMLPKNAPLYIRNIPPSFCKSFQNIEYCPFHLIHKVLFCFLKLIGPSIRNTNKTINFYWFKNYYCWNNKENEHFVGSVIIWYIKKKKVDCEVQKLMLRLSFPYKQKNREVNHILWSYKRKMLLPLYMMHQIWQKI